MSLSFKPAGNSRELRMLSMALSLSFTLIASCVVGALAAGCSSAKVVENDLTEAQLKTTLSVEALKSTRTFEAFSTEGGGFGQSGRLLKFFVDARNGGRATFFINANYMDSGKVPAYATYHYNFAQRQLGIGEDQNDFNDHCYYSNDKRYIGGSIQTFVLGNDSTPTYAIQFYPDDVIHEEGVLQAAKILAPQMRIPGAKLAFVATGPQQTFVRVAAQLRAIGVEPMTIDQVLGSVKYLPLNPGEAWGTLRIFPASQGVLRPSDIPLFDELPLDLSVVAGTITKSYQDVTSHVNLKSKERGTPNMVLRDASLTHPALAAFADKPIHLVVGKTGYLIEASTDEIVLAKLREHQNKPWVSLPVVNQPSLVNYDDMCPTLLPGCMQDGGRFGGKATGLGFLANSQVLGRAWQASSVSRSFAYDLVPYGFGVPVQRYRDFVTANPALASKLDQLIAQEKDGILSRNERAALASDVQQLFYKAHVPDAQLSEVTQAIAALVGRFPNTTALKVRSSANAEDIPNFDGAGLHDSFGMKLDETDNADGSCLLDNHNDSGVITKLDIIPATAQCAIKAVYASLWNPRAIEERSFARLDHATSAMGLAVLPAYDTDANVVANGVVITRLINGSDILGYTVTTQQNNNLVTNPEPGTIAQTSIATFSADATRPDRFTTTRFATPIAGAPPLRESILSDEKLGEIVNIAKAVERPYCAIATDYNDGKCVNIEFSSIKHSSLDMEFKVLRDGHIVLKQVREFHGQ